MPLDLKRVFRVQCNLRENASGLRNHWHLERVTENG